MSRSIATIFRELDQIKRADIPDELKRKFMAQKHAELAAIGQALSDPTAAEKPAEETGNGPRKPQR